MKVKRLSDCERVSRSLDPGEALKGPSVKHKLMESGLTEWDVENWRWKGLRYREFEGYGVEDVGGFKGKG